jgi:hypothetical protein
VVIVVVDRTHRVLKWAQMLHKFVIPHHPTATASCSVPTCYAAVRGCLSVASGMVMLVSGWLAPLLAKFTKCSRVHCAGLRTFTETARFEDTVTVSTRCAIVLRLCNSPFAPRKVEGAKVQRKLNVGVVQSVLYLTPSSPSSQVPSNFGGVA